MLNLCFEIAPKVYRVPTWPALPASYRIPPWFNSFVIKDPDGLTVIDAGFRSSPRRLVAAIESLGHAPSDVKRFLVTHNHFDHTGGSARFVEATGDKVTVIAHETDAPAIRGEVPGDGCDKSTRLGRIASRILPRVTTAAIDVDTELTGGEIIDGAGGRLRAIHTPGHTAGHVSFLDESSGVFFVGDALFNVAGLRPSPKLSCSNLRLYNETADRLADEEFEVVAFAHGLSLRSTPGSSVRERVRKMIRQKLKSQ